MNDWDEKPLLRPSEEGQSPIRVSILGDFVVSHADGRQFLVATKKNRALLTILALSPGFQATRERLCGLLWGDRGDDQARSSLRQSLAVLRKELGGIEDLVLRTHDDIVALRRETAQVDAIDFLALSNDSGITTLRQAAKLYRGELLSDTSIRDAAFEDWLSAERSRLRTAAIKIFDRLIPLEEGHSRIVAAQQLVSFDPLRESSHRLLMQAYADQGDNGLALKQFELCRKLLHEELSVEPARETLELMRRISNGDRKSTKQEIAQTEPSQTTRAEHFPSIAVLPFVNLSGDPQHDYFADGITEDITTELSRFKGLFVIARNSAFSFRAKSIAIATIAKELGVRFLLEGSVRRSGERIRVTARLVDAEAGGEIWAERYDRVIEDIFAVQDDVVRTIVATLEGQLASAVASQSRRQTPSNILAYECVLQARKFLDVYDAHSAEPLLRRAIAADPRYAQANAWMAMVYWVKFFNDHREKDIAEAVAFGKTAVALDPGDSVCHMQLGFAYIFSRQLELADIHSLKALELNPADMLALGLRAQLLCRLGRSQEAIEALDQLVQHDPFPPNWYWENRSIVLLTLDKFEEALAAIQHMPELFWWNHGYVAICCARLGQVKEAQDAIKRALELRPELTIQRFMMGEPFRLPEDANRMVEGLRMAGLAEHAAVSSTRSGTKPSIAVLPFANLSGDTQQDYLADGLAEDVIAGLSRFSTLIVISRNSSFQFRGSSIDAKTVGHELGVQYLVAGSLRRVGQLIRVSAQLIDTASGVQLWSEKYERKLEELLDVQDDMVNAIVTTFEHRIADIRASEISQQPTSNWAAYDYFLKARQMMSQYSNYAAAEEPLLRAIELDPSFSEAYARLAHVTMSKYWANGDRKHIEQALTHAKTAIRLNDRNSAAHTAMCVVSAFMNNYDLAFLHADRALELNPNNTRAALNRAMWQVFVGKSAEALAAFDTILMRDPYPAAHSWELKGAALFQLRRYEEAIKVFSMMSELQFWDRAYLVASYVRLGKKPEAKKELSALIAEHPNVSISRVLQTENYADEASREHLRQALLEAGLPE